MCILNTFKPLKVAADTLLQEEKILNPFPQEAERTCVIRFNAIQNAR